MLLSCFKNQSFKYLWTAGCFTGIARAMEFLTLSLYILNDFGTDLGLCVALMMVLEAIVDPSRAVQPHSSSIVRPRLSGGSRKFDAGHRASGN